MSRPVGKTILIVAGVAIAASIAAAIWVMGGPGAQRLQRMDERRVSDLISLKDSIESYHRENGRLPDDLATLERLPGASLAVTDPVTRQRYGYTRDSAKDYRLCAVFATDTATDGLAVRGIHQEWAHGAGNTCFKRSVKSD